MSAVEWGEPPRDGRNRGVHWTPILAELRSRPGEWAQISGEHSAGMSGSLRRGMIKGAKRGEFEVTVRLIEGSDPMRYRMWARFVGGVA